MADKKNSFVVNYYKELSKLFSGGPIVRQQIANKIKAPGGHGVPVGTAKAFLKSTSTAYASTMASYGQYNRLARFSDYREMECLHPSTLVYTIEHGWVSIEDLYKMYPNKQDTFHVYSYDHKNKKVVIDTAFNVHPTKRDLTYKVTLDDGGFVIANSTHPFMLRDGSYKSVSELQPGDALMPLYKAKFLKGKEYVHINTLSGKGESNNRCWQKEHSYVAEYFLNRKLEKQEVIHHKNFRADDNTVGNLVVMDEFEHRSYHARLNNKHKWSNVEWKKKFSKNHSSFMKRHNPAYREELTFEKIDSYCKSYIENGDMLNFVLVAEHFHTDHETLLRRLKVRGYSKLSDYAKFIQPTWKHAGSINVGEKNPRYKQDVTFQKICNFFKAGMKRKDVEEYFGCSSTVIQKRLVDNGYKNWRDFSQNYVNHKVVSVIPFEETVVYDLSTKNYHNFAVCGKESWVETSNKVRMLRGAVFVHNSMAEIASALDIYSDESCAIGEDGRILNIESPNRDIREALENLFYNVLNIEFEAWGWIRNFCKYGDHYLLLDHHPDYGILSAFTLPVNEIEREEGFDENNPLAYRYRWTTQANKVLDNWQIVHFRLNTNDQFLPYGCSILEAARRVWRQLILMEDAVMVYRIVRSPERRVFKIDVGNVAPQDIPTYMEKIKTQLKRNQIVDSSTGRVDQRYNPMSAEEDYFLPTRGEHSSEISTLPGGQFTGDIEDLRYIQAKLFAALKIPKSYLGYEDDISGKSTLSQLDVRFARTIQRIQRIFISEMNKMAIIHLWSMGYRDSNLINFTLSMANPSTISEMQRLELLRTKLEVSSMIPYSNLFDRKFVYDKIWKLPPEDVDSIEEGKRKDKLFDTEVEQIQAPSPAALPPPNAAPTAPGLGMPGVVPGIMPGVGMGQPGLPPPPQPMGQPGPIVSSKDPNIQSGSPNELVKTNTDKKSKKTMPNLKNYVFNTSKTAMDFKRNNSELTRMVRAPFGEDQGKGQSEILTEEDVFRKRYDFIKQIEQSLEKPELIEESEDNKDKKVFSE